MLHLERDVAFRYLGESRPQLKTVFRSKGSRGIDILEGKREILRTRLSSII